MLVVKNNNNKDWNNLSHSDSIKYHIGINTDFYFYFFVAGSSHNRMKIII